MSVKKFLKYFAHAVAQATDEVVGDMKDSPTRSSSEANFLCMKMFFE
ncbi:hypothetical protein [Romboutsia ilealis]|nr:hypothetical protein [Romboutsia ilealis]